MYLWNKFWYNFPFVDEECEKIRAQVLDAMAGVEPEEEATGEHMYYRCASHINSLVPGRCGCNLKLVIFKLTSRVYILNISCEIALRWMPQDLTGDKSTLVQVMAWCRQATSHYLGQCWPRSISPYGVARPQWVNAKQNDVEHSA